MPYEYECPTERGYEKFKISRKDQNRIFKYRKWVWSINHEYYVKDNHIIIQQIPNVYGCIINTFLFPLGLLLEGLSNGKDTYKQMVTRVWWAKKYGAFSGDDIYKRDNDDGTFDKLMQAKKVI